MTYRPGYLNLENSSTFKDPEIAGYYHLRPPYSSEIFPFLAGLIKGDTPRTLLDVGTGPGPIARPMAQLLNRVDAVDFSEAMIRQGQTLPGGDNPKLHWIVGDVESVPFNPPYGLITAGESLHWMNWEKVFERFKSALVPGGFVALVHCETQTLPWQAGLDRLIGRFSTYSNYEHFDLIEALESRNLFKLAGKIEFEESVFTQSVTDYINSFHSKSSLSRQKMGEQNAADFDATLAELVGSYSEEYGKEGKIELKTISSIQWGATGCYSA